jgi:hypothetical protein
MRMEKRWNDMSIGERIVLSAWIATREHLRADHDELNDIRSRRVNRSNRLALVSDATHPTIDDDEESVEGHVREGAD